MGLKPTKITAYLGSLFIFVGIALLLFIYAPIGWRYAKWRLDQSRRPIPTLSGSAEETAADWTPVSLDFALVIPKIRVNERVFPNVDSTDKNAYMPVLKKGVAHAKGTVLPGERGVVFIFAHSSDNIFSIGQYNAAFFLLNGLEEDDEVGVYYQGEKYLYRVFHKTVVLPGEISQLVAEVPANSLVLQTCWPPGTALKRLLVFAKQVQV